MRQEIINVAPGIEEIHNIVRLIQQLYKGGEQIRAFNVLSAGWPHMQVGQAVKLLNGEIGLEDALNPYAG